MTKFSVNLNKFALLRNSRGTNTPDLLAIARRAIAAGVHGLTVHPRPDQRHARYQDVADLGALVAAHPAVELNVEGNPIEEFLRVVLATRPHQVTLVPDAAGQLTSDHGWNAVAESQRLRAIVARIAAAGIRVSLFLDPDLAQVDAAATTGADRIELYTEPYARTFGTKRQSEVLATFAAAAQRAGERGLGVNAGHDLSLANLATFLAAVPNVLEVSIGHAVVCESFDHGFEGTLARYLAIPGMAPPTGADRPSR
jgi:pyridoxine 5-phosphate synthase